MEKEGKGLTGPPARAMIRNGITGNKGAFSHEEPVCGFLLRLLLLF